MAWVLWLHGHTRQPWMIPALWAIAFSSFALGWVLLIAHWLR